VREALITIDHFHVWREHIAWSKKDESSARDYMVQRFSSNMVFLSLLLGTEIGVLFSPSDPAKVVRAAISDDYNYLNPHFWVGIFLIFSVINTTLAILSSFTAWAIISSLGASNTQCVIRSTVGMYACMLPSRMLIASLYLFLIWISLWMSLLLPIIATWFMGIMCTIMFFHIVTIYSSLGNLILETGAMGEKRVFSIAEEEEMTPSELTVQLLQKAHANRQKRIDDILKYSESEVEAESPSPSQPQSTALSSKSMLKMASTRNLYRDR